MSSELDELMEAANPTFAAVFNETATYTTAAGSATTVTIQPIDQAGERRVVDRGEDTAETLTALLPMSYSLTPAAGDTITLAGQTYTIESWRHAGPDWQITATRTTTAKRQAAGYLETKR